MDIEKLVKAYKKEKDRSVADRMLLIIFIQRDEMSVTGAARRLNKARSWGVKWHRRYLEDGTDGLRDRPRPGRPPKVHKGVMKKIRRLIRKTACWEAERVQSFIKKMTGVEYNLTYVREMMRKWGFSMKVPVMRHVNRAGNRKIARFKKRMRNILETAGKEWTVGVEDESIVVADSRPRRGVYTLGRRRARIHVQRIPYQDHRLRVYHRRRRGILQAVCGIYQGGVCGLFGGDVQVVRQDHNGA